MVRRSCFSARARGHLPAVIVRQATGARGLFVVGKGGFGVRTGGRNVACLRRLFVGGFRFLLLRHWRSPLAGTPKRGRSSATMQAGHGAETSAAGARLLFFAVHIASHPFEKQEEADANDDERNKGFKTGHDSLFLPPGEHFTGMEEARNLRNIVCSFWQLPSVARGLTRHGPESVRAAVILSAGSRRRGRFSALPHHRGQTWRRRVIPPAAAAGRWSPA